MELILQTGLAAFLDAAMALLVFHLVRRKEAVPACDKVLCVAMLFGFALGMAFGEAQHARALLILCGLGVVLSYAAEGLAFAGNEQGAQRHE